MLRVFKLYKFLSKKQKLFFLFVFFGIIFFTFSNQCSKKIFFNSLNQEYSFFKKNTSNNFLRKVSDDSNDMRNYIISCLVMIAEIIFLISLAILLIYIEVCLKKIYKHHFL